MAQLNPQLLISNADGEITSVPDLEAVGMKAGHYYRLSEGDLIKLPKGSQMFMLPNRIPIGFDAEKDEYVELEHHPLLEESELCYAVAAFVSPGYSTTFNSAFLECSKEDMLPLFAYTAVAYYKDDFYVASTKVEWERRQDVDQFDMAIIEKNVEQFKKMLPQNSLLSQIEKCALINGCPAAKNFFQNRYEGPLPSSSTCNAQCIGCISLQPDGLVPATQERLTSQPSAEEIAEIALFHIDNTDDPVVSFGQGCEGEPLTVVDTIEKSITLIRDQTQKGMINMNSNASKPEAVARLFDAGLNSIRVSINSVQTDFYRRYYQPKNYELEDVFQSIKVAKDKGGFVSINYLSLPGFTDWYQEFEALKEFIEHYDIDMIQWRNLNIDPLAYFQWIDVHPLSDELLGMENVISSIHKLYPHLMRGYFNPSKQRLKRFVQSK